MTNKSSKTTKKTAKTAQTLEEKVNKGGRPTKAETFIRKFDDFEFDFDFSKKRKNEVERAYVKQCAEMLMCYGVAPTRVAKIVHVHRSTTLRWYDQLDEEKKRQSDQMLLALIPSNVAGFLNSALKSLSDISEIISREEYVMKHSPEKLGEFVEIIGNQIFRLIEARQRHQLAEKEVELNHRRNLEEMKIRQLEAQIREQRQSDVSSSSLAQADETARSLEVEVEKSFLDQQQSTKVEGEENESSNLQ